MIATSLLVDFLLAYERVWERDVRDFGLALYPKKKNGDFQSKATKMNMLKIAPIVQGSGSRITPPLPYGQDLGGARRPSQESSSPRAQRWVPSGNQEGEAPWHRLSEVPCRRDQRHVRSTAASGTKNALQLPLISNVLCGKSETGPEDVCADDVAEAHRQFPIDPRDWHVLSCQVQAGGDGFVNTVWTLRTAGHEWPRRSEDSAPRGISSSRTTSTSKQEVRITVLRWSCSSSSARPQRATSPGGKTAGVTDL